VVSPAILALRKPVLARWAIRRVTLSLLSVAEIALRPVPANAQPLPANDNLVCSVGFSRAALP
jgi:hypothetical protein